MASGYEKAECGIKPFTRPGHRPGRFTRLVDLCALAAGYGVIALKLYLIWRTFQ